MKKRKEINLTWKIIIFLTLMFIELLIFILIKPAYISYKEKCEKGMIISGMGYYTKQIAPCNSSDNPFDLIASCRMIPSGGINQNCTDKWVPDKKLNEKWLDENCECLQRKVCTDYNLGCRNKCVIYNCFNEYIIEARYWREK